MMDIEQYKIRVWQSARKVIKDDFVADPNPGSMRHAFLCNIAMLLQDKYDIHHALSNEAADNIIKLVFEDTYY